MVAALYVGILSGVSLDDGGEEVDDGFGDELFGEIVACAVGEFHGAFFSADGECRRLACDVTEVAVRHLRVRDTDVYLYGECAEGQAVVVEETHYHTAVDNTVNCFAIDVRADVFLHSVTPCGECKRDILAVVVFAEVDEELQIFLTVFSNRFHDA